MGHQSQLIEKMVARAARNIVWQVREGGLSFEDAVAKVMAGSVCGPATKADAIARAAQQVAA